MEPDFDDDLTADFEEEFSPEVKAELKRMEQDADMGFTYTMLNVNEGDNQCRLQCNKCDRIGYLTDDPFPHKYACPMRESVKY